MGIKLEAFRCSVKLIFFQLEICYTPYVQGKIEIFGVKEAKGIKCSDL